MAEHTEIITGKELMRRWYRWDEKNLYYLSAIS